MSFLNGLYNTLNIVVCNFQDADSYVFSYIRCRRTKSGISIVRSESETENREWLSKYPAVLLLCGYGVVVKTVVEGDRTIEKITGESENFVWNYSPDKTALCFARRSQTDKLDDLLTSEGIKVFKYECCTASQAADDAFLTEIMLSVYSTNITLRRVLKPTEQASVLALYLTKRIRMPLLLVMLGLLLANVFVERNIGARYAASRALLTTLQNNNTHRKDSNNASRAVLSEFNGSLLEKRYAILLDRIASVVPSNVTLTALSVQPKLKAVEQGKKPVLSDRAIVLQGTARSAEDISSFVGRLGTLDFITSIELSSLGTGRNTTSTQFQINAKL